MTAIIPISRSQLEPGDIYTTDIRRQTETGSTVVYVRHVDDVWLITETGDRRAVIGTRPEPTDEPCGECAGSGIILENLPGISLPLESRCSECAGSGKAVRR